MYKTIHIIPNVPINDITAIVHVINNVDITRSNQLANHKIIFNKNKRIVHKTKVPKIEWDQPLCFQGKVNPLLERLSFPWSASANIPRKGYKSSMKENLFNNKTLVNTVVVQMLIWVIFLIRK